MCISKCWKKSWSSREVNGSRTPREPLTVAYRRASEPPGISVALCRDVTVSPTWKFTVISPFCDAPLSRPNEEGRKLLVAVPFLDHINFLYKIMSESK